MDGNPQTPRKIINSWAMYDWANSGFATVILAAVFPVFYRGLATKAGLQNHEATAAWSYTNSVAMIIIAVAGPFLGALADVSARKKWFTGLFAAIGMVGSASLFFLQG